MVFELSNCNLPAAKHDIFVHYLLAACQMVFWRGRNKGKKDMISLNQGAWHLFTPALPSVWPCSVLQALLSRSANDAFTSTGLGMICSCSRALHSYRH